MRFSSFLGLLVALFVVISPAFGTSKAAPILPFFQRYEDAGAIFIGELLESKPADIRPIVFDDYDLEDIKKVKVKVGKSYKGKTTNEIEAYLVYPKFMPTSKSRQKHITLMTAGRKFLIFLRQENGKNVISRYFGFMAMGSDSDDPKDLKALEVLADGGGMDKAILKLEYLEREHFRLFKKTGKKKDNLYDWFLLDRLFLGPDQEQ